MLLIKKDTISVKRTATGTYTAGVYVAGSVSTLSMTGNIQPANPDFINQIKDINLEGKDTTAMIQIFTESPLYTVDDSPSQKADTVTFNGFDYEVRKVAQWNGILLNHYKYLGVKL